ncbi:alpha-ribazole phosphatase [Clostridium thailandense]|uniref:alpha-ribazole phosphatase n=1 Tax=Clostridium thailandense TaxID=2794346 RepID=UPI00398A37CC
MNRKIYLVRHGKIDTGNEKCYIGVTDIPLNEDGIMQAYKLKEFFVNIDIEKAYISPLTRCVQTADIILQDRNIERVLVRNLIEINMGKWEGKSFKCIKALFPEEFEKRGESIDTYTPPEGESFKQVETRVLPTYRAIIENSKGNLLIVAHAGVNRVILSNILSRPLNSILELKQQYGCINELCYEDEYRTWSWKVIV